MEEDKGWRIGRVGSIDWLLLHEPLPLACPGLGCDVPLPDLWEPELRRVNPYNEKYKAE